MWVCAAAAVRDKPLVCGKRAIIHSSCTAADSGRRSTITYQLSAAVQLLLMVTQICKDTIACSGTVPATADNPDRVVASVYVQHPCLICLLAVFAAPAGAGGGSSADDIVDAPVPAEGDSKSSPIKSPSDAATPTAGAAATTETTAPDTKTSPGGDKASAGDDGSAAAAVGEAAQKVVDTAKEVVSGEGGEGAKEEKKGGNPIVNAVKGGAAAVLSTAKAVLLGEKTDEEEGGSKEVADAAGAAGGDEKVEAAAADK